jgi:hypothetical protein
MEFSAPEALLEHFAFLGLLTDGAGNGHVQS